MERREGDLSERKKLILRAIIDAYISGDAERSDRIFFRYGKK